MKEETKWMREGRMKQGQKMYKYPFFSGKKFPNYFSHMIKKICDQKKCRNDWFFTTKAASHFLLHSFAPKPSCSWLHIKMVIMVCQTSIKMLYHLKSVSLYFCSFGEFLLPAQLRVAILRLSIWLPFRCHAVSLFSYLSLIKQSWV